MNNNDKPKFAEIITGVAELYGKDISAAAASIWFNSLKEYHIDSLAKAFSVHVTNPDNGQFFPKPADIIRSIEGTSQDASFVAWTKVDETIRTIGPYQSVVFDDPIIHAVIDDMGGWIMFGEKTEDEWPFVSLEFQKRYKGYKSRKQVPPHSKILIGQHEAKNRQHDFEIEPPLFIGDQEKAKQVYLAAPGKRQEVSKMSEVVGLIEENIKGV